MRFIFNGGLDDYLILVTERMRSTVSNGKALEMKDFTVMFAPRPYDVWSVLFSVVGTFLTSTSHSKGQKEGQVIDEIIGIIFNHHRRQFDITLEVVVSNRSILFYRDPLSTNFNILLVLCR